MTITDRKSKQVKESIFYIQNKATKKIKIRHGNVILKDFYKKHLIKYRKSNIPVLIIRYDALNDCAYWLNAQNYIKNVLDVLKPNWMRKNPKKGKLTIKIPIVNKLEKKNKIVALDIIKKEILNSIKEIHRSKVHNYKWYEGYENIINDTENFEKIIQKSEFDNVEARFHISNIYMRNDELERVNQNFNMIYNQRLGDVNHLKSILGVISTKNIFDLNNFNDLVILIDEGLALANVLNKNFEYDYFYFLYNVLGLISTYHRKFFQMSLKKVLNENNTNLDDQQKSIINDWNTDVESNLDFYLEVITEIIVKYFKRKNYDIFISFMNIFYQIWIWQVKIHNHFGYKIPDEIFMKQKEYLRNLIILGDKLNDIDLSLTQYLTIGEFLILQKDEMGYELINKGIRLAQKTNYIFYINAFGALLNESV